MTRLFNRSFLNRHNVVWVFPDKGGRRSRPTVEDPADDIFLPRGSGSNAIGWTTRAGRESSPGRRCLAVLVAGQEKVHAHEHPGPQ
eukprot:CAMPEP_0171026460 /NCGR_PEP_ID=MMETSP0736-20130129/34314_1 /TAXON_ID=186038 /ORGANISM="Fragilariopsis kerguelensis, Strain L26-C5" /LENGTH=85 /DNA_ID=CAMNT_0011467037 /DNA_START=305 /DNA_END=562 /DNA_ORIENTATION=+